MKFMQWSYLKTTSKVVTKVLYYEYISKSMYIGVATSAGLFHIENISNFKMTEGNR